MMQSEFARAREAREAMGKPRRMSPYLPPEAWAGVIK